ncbi:hypothetical protein [Roseofilum sp. Belize Diploria]|uniref:hypothetical protein n=1 Tax=Roseofilum sp. Belize Diploria TaxID=2821501 RepID=UPI001AFFE011|nr:hypothetical protein [Roseofilum sp. Belize Diploria]MBP0010788.1 hypothetical protein [Roseofilum sp. Belize Diploria]
MVLNWACIVRTFLPLPGDERIERFLIRICPRAISFFSCWRSPYHGVASSILSLFSQTSTLEFE